MLGSFLIGMLANSIKKFMTDFAKTACVKIVKKELNTEEKKLELLRMILKQL